MHYYYRIALHCYLGPWSHRHGLPRSKRLRSLLRRFLLQARRNFDLYWGQSLLRLLWLLWIHSDQLIHRGKITASVLQVLPQLYSRPDHTYLQLESSVLAHLSSMRLIDQLIPSMTELPLLTLDCWYQRRRVPREHPCKITYLLRRLWNLVRPSPTIAISTQSPLFWVSSCWNRRRQWPCSWDRTCSKRIYLLWRSSLSNCSLWWGSWS